MKELKPFIKWAGGKTQLLPTLLNNLPPKFNNYYEPFIGGGAMLFEIKAKKFIINDINEQLILSYNYIKDDVESLIKQLTKIDKEQLLSPKEYYYLKRERYNDLIENNSKDIEVAALFIYLNKHCFNGLYRVNSKGLFNVPHNGSKRGSFVAENLVNVSKFLQKVTILNGDFEDSVKTAKKGDFIFFDSPYAPLNPTSFIDYSKEGFDLASHERLANLFKALDKKGCYCLLTNHNTKLINELYSDYNQDVVAVRRAINSNANARTGEEIIIRNY